MKLTAKEKEERARRYQIGKKLSDRYKNDKKLNVSEVVSLAKEKKTILNLLFKWDDAPEDQKDEILEKIKEKMPKKPRPFGN